MKLDAHPLVVAVAMGLLNPAALVDVDDDDAIVEHVSAESETWEPMFPAPDEAELHRVEIEWLKHQ